MMSDNIADMLTRIRNAYKSKLVETSVPSSRQKIAILNVLRKEGYIGDFTIKDEGNNKSSINIMLKYSTRGDSALVEIVRKSKPGRRLYTKANQLTNNRNNMGIDIVSTPRGILSGREAVDKNVGGEFLCTVF